MNPIPQPPPTFNTRRLTWLYVMALSMVAILTIIGQFAVQRALRQLEGDAGIVNVAGRQRMLSQRLPRLVLAIQHDALSAQGSENRDELSRMLQLWETNQRALESGSNALALPGGNSQAIQALFQAIEANFVAVRDGVNSLLPQANDAWARELAADELRSLLANSDAFLIGMDRIVSQYALEAQQRVSRLQSTERGLLAATLLVLLCEGCFVFSPAVASLRRTFDQLRAVTTQLAQAKEVAESANRAKTNFLTHLSHELRTPLHAILGMLSLLRRGRLEPAQQRHLRLTQQAARTLQSLVNDLLDAAELERESEPQMHNRPVRLPRLIQAAIELMRPMAAKKSLRMSSNIEPDFPLWIVGDPYRLRQIIYNLLQNAIRYTDRGTIECQCRIERGVQPARIVLLFSDTGCGIAPEDQSRIFERFVRVGKNRSAEAFGEGLGVGLPITAALVKAMAGQLTIDSELGRGTRISVHLPLVEADSPNRARRPTKQRSKARPSAAWALVVDDSKANRILMRHYLKRLGYRTRSASNAIQAIAECRRKSPDVIVLDKHLKNDDGLELIAGLRACIQDKAPAIYVVTADRYCQAEGLHHRYGISAVLHKPLQFGELKQALAVRSRELDSDDGFSELRLKLQAAMRKQLPIDIARIAESLALNDFQHVGLLAHRIRGGSANAGLTEIETISIRLEEQSSSMNREACAASAHELAAAIERFI